MVIFGHFVVRRLRHEHEEKEEKKRYDTAENVRPDIRDVRTDHVNIQETQGYHDLPDRSEGSSRVRLRKKDSESAILIGRRLSGTYRGDFPDIHREECHAPAIRHTSQDATHVKPTNGRGRGEDAPRQEERDRNGKESSLPTYRVGNDT